MEISILGSGREVGRSAILVKTKNENFLFDYGVEVQTMELPLKPDINKLTNVFLSHPHLDHSGSLPYLYKMGYKKGVWANPVAFELSALLLRDSLKVQQKKGLTPYFQLEDIENFERHRRFLGYRQPIKTNDLKLELFDAGHLPGSASILLEGKKRILYTGDANFVRTELTPEADTDYKDIDVLITECTYSYKDHPDRKILANGLREHVREVMESGGKVLLPCFAVGRTQEMLLNLNKLKYPIYIDGMGKTATEIVLRHKDMILNHGELKKAFGRARKITRASMRKAALKEPCIIIATAGMLQAGSAIWYAKKLANDQKSSMIFTGYQVEGTPGRTLLDTGRLVFPEDNFDVKPKMDVRYLDFSDHADRQHLLKFINNLSPKKIVLDHGPQAEIFRDELKAKGFDVAAPENGDTIMA